MTEVQRLAQLVADRLHGEVQSETGVKFPDENGVTFHDERKVFFNASYAGGRIQVTYYERDHRYPKIEVYFLKRLWYKDDESLCLRLHHLLHPLPLS